MMSDGHGFPGEEGSARTTSSQAEVPYDGAMVSHDEDVAGSQITMENAAGM